MPELAGFEAIPIGFELGPFELTLDEETVKEKVKLAQWADESLMNELGIAPPGITISHHARMKFTALPDLKASIWAKSEHEFIKPMKIGSTVTIRGKVVEKYNRRGRNYVVTEYETVDESGEVLLRSIETGLYVE
jgi:acyl dehydratase